MRGRKYPEVEFLTRTRCSFCCRWEMCAGYAAEFWNMLFLMFKPISACEGVSYASQHVLCELNSRVLTYADMRQGSIQICVSNVWKDICQFLTVPMSDPMKTFLIYCRDQDNSQKLWISATALLPPNLVTLRKITNLLINLSRCLKCLPETF